MTSFANDILPMFNAGDIRCMRRFAVMLDDYAYMSDPAGDGEYPDHANARRVHCFLVPDGCTPRMPRGGPYWSDEWLELYRRWMDEGFAP